MVEDHKKSESEDESERNAYKLSVAEALEEIQSTLKVLIARVDAMERGDNTGFRHENDGGYFD